MDLTTLSMDGAFGDHRPGNLPQVTDSLAESRNPASVDMQRVYTPAVRPINRADAFATFH